MDKDRKPLTDEEFSRILGGDAGFLILSIICLIFPLVLWIVNLFYQSWTIAWIGYSVPMLYIGIIAIHYKRFQEKKEKEEMKNREKEK